MEKVRVFPSASVSGGRSVSHRRTALLEGEPGRAFRSESKAPAAVRQGREVPNTDQNVILAESTVANASPGPRPGAPFQSPMVSVI